MAEEENNGQNNGGNSTNKLLIVLVVVFLIMNAAWGAVFFLGFNDTDDATETSEESADEEDDAVQLVDYQPGELGPTMELQPFIVNLNEPQSTRFLRISITLELNDETTQPKVEQQMVRLRDQFINYLSGQTVNELRTSEGKESLRTELLNASHTIIPGKEIRNIYFTDFMIQ